jgi:hypothetical protein
MAEASALTLRARFSSDLEEEDRLSWDDVLVGYRRRLFRSPTIAPPARAMGVHDSTC